MSNDDHKKAPQSPEEMLAMIGKREDVVARDGDEREDSGQAKRPETIAREEIAKGPPEISTAERPIGSPFGGLGLLLQEARDRMEEEILQGSAVPEETLFGGCGYHTPEDHEEAKDTEEDTENRDPLADLKEAYRELCGDVLPPSGYRTPEEHEAAQDTADSEGDQDDNAGGYIELDILIEPPTSPEPDADVMGYLHSAFNREPDYEIQESRPIDIRSHTGVKYSVELDTMVISFTPCSADEWVFEISTKKSWRGAISFHDSLEECVDKAKDESRKVLAGDLDHLTDAP